MGHHLIGKILATHGGAAETPPGTEGELRVNQTLTLIPPEARAATTLRPVELLVIAPSERIDVIAARHVGRLPAAVRRLFGVQADADGTDVKGAALASYLLFDRGFTGELMALGRADALRQRAQLQRFLGWPA